MKDLKETHKDWIGIYHNAATKEYCSSIIDRYNFANTMTDINHKEQLIQRSNNLQAELQELQKSFDLKKEEYLKLQGALEMLQVLENENNATDSQGT